MSHSTPIPAGWEKVAARQRWAADLRIPGETCMRTARCLLTVVIVLLYTSHVAAQTEARSDGTLIEQTPCTPPPVRTYEQYVEAFKRFQTMEVEAAQREGFHNEMPADIAQRLVSREEFEHHR